jgi:general secretion pathway protein A
MYSRHFDLTQDPFSIAPDPRFLFMSDQHREALAHLLFGVSGTGGFVLFTGDIGAGKTTVCRCFLEQIPTGCNVAIVFNPKLSVMELLQTICEEFHVSVDTTLGATSLKSYVDALNVYLLQSHADGHSNVLIIDEAQNLLPDVLEQLRLLTNLETHERKLLQIVLIGQPELRTMLERPDLEQLAQRVIARYHLGSLNETETSRYILHRLTVAGRSGPLPFDNKALRRIHVLTRGVPRRINLLCGRTLLGAWATGQHRVDRTMIDKAAREVFSGAESAVRPPPSYGAPLLGAIGTLCLALALGLQFLPRTERQMAMASPQPAPRPAVAAPAVAVSAPPAPATDATVVPRSVGAPVQDMQDLLPLLAKDMVTAWRALGRFWKINPISEDPCQAAALQQWQCYRTNELSIPVLRQLDRPGVLTLQATDGLPRYLVLVGLDEKTATLKLQGADHRVTLISLARFWRGEFATYWQPPNGYSQDMREGQSNVALGQLSDQLALLEGHPRSQASGTLPLDGALTGRVKAFQKGQGIKADGHPGPMTFMQLEKALGFKGPSLDAGMP